MTYQKDKRLSGSGDEEKKKSLHIAGEKTY
jgi:hypothetical protein